MYREAAGNRVLHLLKYISVVDILMDGVTQLYICAAAETGDPI